MGKMQRDFTYIDYIKDDTILALDHAAHANPIFDSDSPDPASSSAPFRLYNIGNHNPIELMDFFQTIKKT
jgi:UDP-glucuronate 4-epimerase